MTPWTLQDRTRDLERAAAEGVELLVIGGGITGGGVLRDAAQRGLAALLVEADDFAGGTSSATSKMIHGGLRYLAAGQLRVTRQSCVERDRLRRLNPHLVHDLPFLFCSFDDGVPPWQVRIGLTLYGLLAGIGKGRHRMLPPAEVEHLSRDLRRDGRRAVGMYYDAQVDDARFVLEVLKSARRLGASAVSYAAVSGFAHHSDGRLAAAQIQDRLTGRSYTVRAQLFVNATGPSVDRIRQLDDDLSRHELRPAKGVHVVVRRERLHADAAVAFQASDRRNVFLCPYDNVHLIGTTDTFTDQITAPIVRWPEVDYLLAAANRAFPNANLSRDDVISVWAGVRPLVASADDVKPASSVSREHRITADRSGLVSIAGGKLTTFRAMAEQLVDQVIAQLPTSRQQQLKPCRTASTPLRVDSFDRDQLTAELMEKFQLDDHRCRRMIEAWGADATTLLQECPSEWWEPIGESRYLYAELAGALRYECAANLCDLLERRLRLAALCPGQGLPELDRIGQIAGQVAGWSATRIEQELQAYRTRVQTRYQAQE